MKIRPSDSRVSFPLTESFTIDDVVWAYLPPSKTWEVRLGWVIFEITDAELEPFISTWVRHWEDMMLTAHKIPDTRKLTNPCSCQAQHRKAPGGGKS